jgi:hypothetical protein
MTGTRSHGCWGTAGPGVIENCAEFNDLIAKGDQARRLFDQAIAIASSVSTRE